MLERVWRGEPLYTVGQDVIGRIHCGKQYEGFSKNEKLNFHLIQQFHSWVYKKIHIYQRH